MKTRFAAAAAAFLFSSALAAPAGAQVTIGNANSGNCYPFSCSAADNVTRYQQSFRAGAFTAPLTFDTLSYDVESRFANNLNTASYSISFYYAANGYAGLSSDLDFNRGSAIGSFGTFGVGGAAPATLSFTGSRLSYDPMLGDLLMDVSIANVVNDDARYSVFYNADYSGSPDTLRAFINNNGASGATNGALVTTFSLAGAVPEPATWALMILGFGAVGGAMRRRQSVAAKVRFA